MARECFYPWVTNCTNKKEADAKVNLKIKDLPSTTILLTNTNVRKCQTLSMVSEEDFSSALSRVVGDGVGAPGMRSTPMDDPYLWQEKEVVVAMASNLLKSGACIARHIYILFLLASYY